MGIEILFLEDKRITAQYMYIVCAVHFKILTLINYHATAIKSYLIDAVLLYIMFALK